MKIVIAAAVVTLAGAFAAAPASAQMVQNSGWQGHDMINNGMPITGDAQTSSRLNGQSHQDYIDGLVAQDRKTIKDLKKMAKSPDATDEDKAAIKAKIRELESDIIALQQQ